MRGKTKCTTQDRSRGDHVESIGASANSKTGFAYTVLATVSLVLLKT